MLPIKPLFFPLVATLLFFSPALFYVSYGESRLLTSRRPPTISVSGEVFEVPKRFLDEGNSEDEAPLNSSSLVLAAKRTYRKDPLDGFKRYTGGWNISEPHYWAVGSTQSATRRIQTQEISSSTWSLSGDDGDLRIILFQVGSHCSY